MDSDLSFFDAHDPTQAFKSLLAEAMQKEFVEETKSQPEALEPLGLFRMIKNSTEFSYISRLACTSEQFLEQMAHAEDAADHRQVAVLKNDEEVQRFLRSEPLVCANGRAALEFYLSR